MVSIETIRDRRCAYRAFAKSSTSPMRQDLRILHSAHGQGGGRGSRPCGGLVLGHKRQKSSGKSRSYINAFVLIILIQNLTIPVLIYVISVFI